MFAFLVGCGGASPTDPDLVPPEDTGSDSSSGDDTASKDTGASDDTGSGTDTGSGADTGSGTDSGSTTDSIVDDAPTDSGTTADTSVTDSVIVDAPTDGSTAHVIKYVWVVVMENRNWSSIKGSASAPYINKTLLDKFAHAEEYYNPPKLHPSEPNYIWMEAGDNLGITNDSDPSANHQATTNHLVTKLQAAGITWKAYQEDIDGKSCPLTSVGHYAPKHCPMVFFDDVTDGNKTTSANCIAHVRPYGELATDMAAAKVPQYNFVTPNLCNDMHGETLGTTCPPVLTDLIKRGDTWLSTEIPKIMASTEYKTAGAIFITWDEGEGLLTTSDGPIGMIVVSPFAKVKYSNSIKYTHSSLLRTVQTIFSITPYIRDADKATDLSDLFTTFP